MRIRSFFDYHFVACLIAHTLVVFGLLGALLVNQTAYAKGHWGLNRALLQQRYMRGPFIDPWLAGALGIALPFIVIALVYFRQAAAVGGGEAL